MTTALRFVLGDQLSLDISSLEGLDTEKDTVLMAEVWDEATYVKHHKKKIAFLFSAMRHFAETLRNQGVMVRYIKLDDPQNTGSFHKELERAVTDIKPDTVVVTEPGEYRVRKDMLGWEDALGIDVDIRPDTRFLSTYQEFADWADGRKQLRMEYFYREMRKKYHILMDDDTPEGGDWNYDSENRKPPKDGLDIPSPTRFDIDAITQDCINLVADRFSDHFGDLEPFNFAVTPEQAQKVLDDFMTHRLTYFGDYQDAMIQGEPWMYHSHLSFYLNCGLLDPMSCVKRAEQAYRDGIAPLNAVEGFIRQILGWREYIRGLYWYRMPAMKHENFLDAKRTLPAIYWGEKTHMNCLSQCVKETKENAYAHHIQRLMVLGNFALLAGLNPDEVNEWYLIVYADAYEWVELPNVSDMILFADGGKLASKPYAASGAYINRMSDYCKNCHYKVSVKNGPDACPFNYLYWDFMDRHQDKLRGNPRLNMPYRNLDKMSDDKRQAVRDDARRFFDKLDAGEVV